MAHIDQQKSCLMIVRSFLGSLKHLFPLEIIATSSPSEQTALTASPTLPQASNSKAQAQMQAQNVETPAPRQMLGRAICYAAILEEFAQKYRS